MARRLKMDCQRMMARLCSWNSHKPWANSSIHSWRIWVILALDRLGSEIRSWHSKSHLQSLKSILISNRIHWIKIQIYFMASKTTRNWLTFQTSMKSRKFWPLSSRWKIWPSLKMWNLSMNATRCHVKPSRPHWLTMPILWTTVGFVFCRTLQLMQP